MAHTTRTQPGLIALLGSGETTAIGGKVYDLLAQRLGAPLRAAVLETPAGFQPNAPQVAGRVASYLSTRLQNYQPAVETVPARKRETPFSPDRPGIAARVAVADLIFLGPGSPTYTTRQLAGSLTWQALCARHHEGAALALASAAVLAVSAQTLPVYEIYKVGADPHWTPGLDLFGAYGLSLILVPHWNNSEGGAELDTSFCFMGRKRWQALRDLLPAGATIVGIDEHTALVADMAEGRCIVLGRGEVTLLRGDEEQRFASGAQFELALLGEARAPTAPAMPEALLPLLAEASAIAQEPEHSPELLALVAARAQARAARDWAAADRLREQLAALGWQVKDTPAGPELLPL